MNNAEATNKIDFVKEQFLKMQGVIFVDENAFKADPETGEQPLTGSDDMAEMFPEENAKLHSYWKEIQKFIPSGFDIDGNLIRHLSFNEASDWYDIAKRDRKAMGT